MKGLVIVVLGLLLFSSMAWAQEGSVGSRTILERIAGAFTQLNQRLDVLAAQVAALIENRSTMRSEIENLRYMIEILTGKVDLMAIDILNLQENRAETEGQIAQLHDDVNNVQEEISGIHSDVSILQDGVVILQADVEELKQNQNSSIEFGQLLDTNAGAALGWDPDGVKQFFSILDDRVQTDSVVSVFVNNGVAFCYPTVLSFDAQQGKFVGFVLACNGSVQDNAVLNYAIMGPN